MFGKRAQLRDIEIFKLIRAKTSENIYFKIPRQVILEGYGTDHMSQKQNILNSFCCYSNTLEKVNFSILKRGTNPAVITSVTSARHTSSKKPHASIMTGAKGQVERIFAQQKHIENSQGPMHRNMLSAACSEGSPEQFRTCARGSGMKNNKIKLVNNIKSNMVKYGPEQ